MTRLGDRFAELKARGERGLVCYVMAGDPSLAATAEIVYALEAAGTDAIELGVPFSDPLADGPSIQAAGHRALANGVTVPGVFDVVRQVRRTSQIPIVLMTYYNPALAYGIEHFANEAAEVGVDGVIQTDLTPEEAGPWIDAATRAGLDRVFLLAPTSTPDRIEVVTRIGTGFIYCVSRTGVTGARSELPDELAEFVGRVKSATPLPLCVGFGVSKPEHARQIGAIADGVVVGSALVDLIARESSSSELNAKVTSFAASLKAATRE